MSHESAALIGGLRQAVDDMLVRMATDPTLATQPSPHDSSILQAVYALTSSKLTPPSIPEQPPGGWVPCSCLHSCSLLFPSLLSSFLPTHTLITLLLPLPSFPLLLTAPLVPPSPPEALIRDTDLVAISLHTEVEDPLATPLEEDIISPGGPPEGGSGVMAGDTVDDPPTD